MRDIVILAVISVLISMMIPAARNDSMKKTVTFVMGLALLLTIARPVAEASEKLRDLPQRFLDLFLPRTEELEQEAEQARQWVIGYGTENIENGVSALVENRFSLPAGSVRTEAVTAEDGEGNLLLVRLVIRVGPSAPCGSAEMEAFVSSMLACPCEVIVDGENP